MIWWLVRRRILAVWMWRASVTFDYPGRHGSVGGTFIAPRRLGWLARQIAAARASHRQDGKVVDFSSIRCEAP